MRPAKWQFLTWGRGMQVDVAEFSRRLQAIGNAEDVVAVRETAYAALNLFGIEKVYYVAPIPGDARVQPIITNVGLPWIWERQYRARLYEIDPLPMIAKQRLQPFVWPDDIGDENLTRKQERYLALAAQYGAGRGVGIACFGPDGRSGFMGCILPDDAEKPAQDTLLRLHSIGQVSIQRYCKLVPAALSIPALSNRELEVLRWMGQGKSNSVIAEILGISASSVDVYVRRIFAKLDVSDRTTAAVKALSLGLIVSSDYERIVREAAKLQKGRKNPLER